RLLSHQWGLLRKTIINSIDFQDHFIFTGSDLICKWDLGSNTGDELIMDPCSNDRVIAVYVIGCHVLFATVRALLIRDCKSLDFSVLKEHYYRNVSMVPSGEYDQSLVLISFNLHGTRLITEVHNVYKNTSCVNVYDLTRAIAKK